MGSVLTRRENEIVSRLRLGLPLKVIALELGLHPSTVSTHVSAAARKLGAHGRVDLVRALDGEGGDPEESWAPLSPGERDVARLARTGLSNAEIARARGTSPRTVANQLARIYRKLGMGSRMDLAVAKAAMIECRSGDSP